MKKLFLITMIIVLMVGLVLGGCAKETPTPTPTPAEVIELKWTHMEPDNDLPIAASAKELARQIEEKTNGRVKVTIYWGAQLGATRDFLKMVSEGGVAQGATATHTSYHIWEVPLWAAHGLPFFTTDPLKKMKATWAMGKEWAPMQEELERMNLKVIGLINMYHYRAVLMKPIDSIDELKGKKISSYVFWPKLLPELGVVNITIAAPELYDGLQKGMVDGTWGSFYGGMRIMKFYELCKYFYSLDDFGGEGTFINAINLDVWKQISAQDQKAIEAIGEDVMFNYHPKAVDESMGVLREFYKAEGVSPDLELSAADIATIEKIGKDLIWNDWLESAKERGVPGEEWMQRYQDALAKIK